MTPIQRNFLFFLVFTTLVIKFEARLLPLFDDKNIDNNLLLHKLRINVAQKLSINTAAGEAATERDAPDGPDPQHHYIPYHSQP